MRISESVAVNRAVTAGLVQAGQQIRDGQGISAAFASVKMFPPLVLRMLRIGETTGGLDRALLNVSYFYNREVKEGIDRVQAMIGPGMVLVLGTILGDGRVGPRRDHPGRQRPAAPGRRFEPAHLERR